MTDDLRHRLRAADPVAALTPDPSRITTLAEAAMSTDLDDTGTTTTAGERRTGTGLRVLAAAAAVAAVAALGTAGYVSFGPDDQPAAAPTTMELSLPPGDVMSSCIQYSVDFLADMPVAFSGTVESVDDSSVQLEVDRWYRGGDADVVELANPSGPMTSIDGVEFVDGTRYLVTASEGTVNGCGYTAVWTESMAQDFATAFGG